MSQPISKPELLLKPELLVKVRLQVLYDVVKELVQAFSVDYPEQTARLIRQGILEKQYFRAIHIYFLNNSGKRVGEAILEIDWDMHTVKVRDGENTFHIDSNKSVHEQISEVFPILVRHVNKMKRVLGVTRTEVWYSWRHEIASDSKRYRDAKIELGFSVEDTRRPPEWSETPTGTNDYDDDIDDIYFEYVSQSLQELRVIIKHKLQ